MSKNECTICGGMGFIIPDVPPIDPRFGRAVPCTCKQGELENKRRSTLLRMSQLGALQNCTFASFAPEGIGLPPAKARNLTDAYKRAKTFAQKPEGWLIFKGSYGCGKTHLAAAIANYQLEHGRQVLFVNTPDLLDHLRATYNPSSPVTYDEQFERVRNAPLLILDDLGAQSATEWAQEKLYQIFNYRYNARLPTVITTNIPLESIEIRIRSRMTDLSFVQIVTILAPDFRRGGIYQEESDLSSLHLHSDKQLTNFSVRSDELTQTLSSNLRRALETAQAFAAQPTGWLVYQSTSYGNGKTHLAAAIANEITRRGESALFIVVPDLLDHLRATFSPASGTRLDKRFDEVRNSKLLILDDLGTESATNWAREKLYQLFNHRYSAQLPTVITTATPIDELDPRLAARMLDGNRCEFFVLEAPSYRGGGRDSGRQGGNRNGRRRR
ncbi:MAG: ATP-binding protein [Anaerolineae bacterium]|nr:ATP-binding protein [Anaerolineae bacterium]MCO5196555.1 ATP-binding protein [Anaerolineae bacterium]